MAGNKGQGGVKGLLLRHGEKIAISLVGLIALWMIYKATTLPRLADKFQASKLQDEIRQTSSAVRDAQWPDKKSELASNVREAQPIGAKVDNSVNPKAYKTDANLDNTIVAPTVLRTDPALLNAVDVRAYGGSGLLAFADEAIRKQQELKRKTEDDERARKDAAALEKQNKATAAGRPPAGEAGPGRRPRGPEGPGASSNDIADAAHPKRRAVEGMSGAALGVQRQGGERIERASWAIVVAKVPIREQLKLYQDAFEKARGGFDPARDLPQYKGYLVQRSEVLPGKPLDWKPVPVYDGQRQSVASNKPLSPYGVGEPVMARLAEAAAKYWAGIMPEVVDPRFTDYILTFPLPPLMGRDWGSEATHPDIPLAGNGPPVDDNLAPLPTAPTDQPAANDENSTFGNAGAAGTMPGGTPFPAGPPGRPMGPGMGMGMGMRPRGPGPEGGMGGFPRGPGGPEGGGGSRMNVGSMPGAAGARTSLPKGVDFLLLRFFDFTVEPGKKYKYRVQLVLADPNFATPDSMLAPAVLDRRRQETVAAKAKNTTRQDIRRIETWSEPSSTVGIPLAGNARLAEVKLPAAEKFNDEPSAKLLVESFDVDGNNAIQSGKEKDMHRGSVGNMVEDAEYLSGDGPWIDTREKFKFVTGLTLVDIDGGKKLGKDLYSPGRVLLMGSTGDLYIRNELDDKSAIDYHKLLFDQDDKRRKPGGPEGPQGPGGPGTGRPRPGAGRPSGAKR